MASEIEFVNYKQFVEGLSSVDSAESTDKSVVCNPVGGPRKFDAFQQNKLKFFVVTDNPEYLYAITDNDGRFLFGIKKDGGVEWAKGIPSPIEENFDELAIKKVDKEVGKGLINAIFANAQGITDNPEYMRIITDSVNKLLVAINKDGQFEFFKAAKFTGGVDWSKGDITELSKALKKYGFTGGQGDWSDSTYLHINKPKCAIVNFKNISAMPVTKTQNLNGIIQFWDMEGNYFQKNVIMNAQGSSSLVHPKKNIAIDFANEDWSEDGAFDLKIGDWVAQDSFHLKASWGEFFRCVGTVCYDILDEMMKTRGISYDAPWKQALIDQPNYPTGKGLAYDSVSDLSLRLDTGAKNHPMGFPCVVFLNDEFYGIFAWSIKKQRKNYHQEKKNVKHIHLDGEISREYLFNGSVDWTKIEIRNPTGLKYKYPKTIHGVETYDYDHDYPDELSDTDSKSVQVKTSIIGLSGVIAQLKNAVTTYGIDSQELKGLYETFFNVDNIIDYVVFSDIIGNTDGWRTNWQWVTYDGTKWWVCPYDLDRSFGTGLGYPVDPITGHMMVVDTLPHYYVIMNSDYNARLEQRYKELRDKGIFSVDNFMAKMNEFIQAVGFDFYEKEFSPEHWADSPNNSEMQVDTEHWELVLVDGKPVFGNSSTYNADTTYQVGDTCFYGPSKCFGYYKFECVSPTTGNRPIATLGFRDSIWRLRAWLDEHFDDMDTLYNYD